MARNAKATAAPGVLIPGPEPTQRLELVVRTLDGNVYRPIFYLGPAYVPNTTSPQKMRFEIWGGDDHTVLVSAIESIRWEPVV